MEEVTTVISTVGFPIAMCILLFWYMQQQMKTHKEETDQLKNVINENNVILAGLKQLIEDKLNA
jgi:preprotein translocase subunit YajC